MDLSKNLLIIGAGAHVPYGMQTGQQLSYLIKDYYRSGLLNNGVESLNGEIQLGQIAGYRIQFESIIKQMNSHPRVARAVS